MRTTLDIDDDVLVAAKNLARMKNQGVGRALSDLARRGLHPQNAPLVEVEYGIPVWKHGAGAITVTNEMVRNLAEEE